MTSTRRSQGFTIIELLVVIYILGIMSAIVLPNMNRWYASIKINNAKRDLISNLRLVQQNAVTTQINYSVILDSAGNRYHLVKKSSPDEIVKTVILPTRITFGTIALNPVVNEIIFNSAGAPSATGDITLTNNYAVNKSISITPSGFIKEQ